MCSKISVRPLVEEDAEVSYTWRNDSRVWKHTKNRPDEIITREIERNWIKKAISDKSAFRYAILFDDNYIGNVQLTDVDHQAKQGEFHIFIGNLDYWGRGIGAEATSLFLKEVKNKLQLEFIYLFVSTKNIAAVKVYKKIGFTFDPVQDEKMVIKL